MNDRNIKHITINIMEELVAEEVTRQIKRLPPNIGDYINRVEVATFALNRLPALYASCHKGLNKQKLKGKTKHSVEITKAVRQGLAAIQQDVLRYSNPLKVEEDPDLEVTQNMELEEARKALVELAHFFPNGEISWQQLVQAIKPLLKENRRAIADNLRYSQSPASEEWGDYSYRE